LVMNKEEINKNVEMLSNSKKREGLTLRVGELADYFSELKTKLDYCDMNELPEEVITRADGALNWLLDFLFLNTPEGLADLLVYLYPEYWDDLDLDELEEDGDDMEE
jgi:hypothetical protein